ncbi:hypothetical protein H257_01030 [Aphanomyces astaci]|uniref:Methyltransferase-domain-containing protein n=1 Tax=Aphanomyces astaci TaxID=112090 RepID=W4H7B7_APHAT|nr:hypothetical protein H257_01030 [Aphanomyces astaci]ETV87466.1 hypothetical protein H257_01030 [Aphanomyces astaci]|eukprot:XP_009822329.1 hypothetical protein H257_01030 [Aphanomyces astaci]
MTTQAVELYRLRFRFSPPPFISHAESRVKLHVEVINECGQGISAITAHPNTPLVQGWVIGVRPCDPVTFVPMSIAESAVVMAPHQRHATIYVSLPKSCSPLRFHAQLHSNNATSAHATMSLQSFTCGASMGTHGHVLVLPVWSNTIVRTHPSSNDTSASVATCLRRFSIQRPTDQVPSLVTVEERYGDAMASHVWDAGICLSYFLQTYHLPQLSQPLHAMEIASGSGLLGLVLATLLPPHSTLVLTDKPSNLDLLGYNVRQHQSTRPSPPCSVAVCSLEWGNAVHLEALLAPHNPPHLLLLADVLYNWAAHPQLWATVAAIATPLTTIFLAHKDRAATSTAALRHLHVHGTCPSCSLFSTIPSTCGWQQGLWKLELRASFGSTDIFQLVIQHHLST